MKASKRNYTTTHTSKDQARSAIFSQDLPSPTLKSAWMLFEHELAREDAVTGEKFTVQEALDNILCWLEHQKRLSRMAHLTHMERSILHLLVYEGLSMKQVAARLHKSYPQIKQKAFTIREKLGATTMVQAAVRAAQMGWKSTSHLEE